MSEYIHCPQCGGIDIVETDYDEEDEDGEMIVDDSGRGCNDCGWEGNIDELVAEG